MDNVAYEHEPDEPHVFEQLDDSQILHAVEIYGAELRERLARGEITRLPEDLDGPNTPWYKRKIKKFTDAETKQILHNVNTKFKR